MLINVAYSATNKVRIAGIQVRRRRSERISIASDAALHNNFLTAAFLVVAGTSGDCVAERQSELCRAVRAGRIKRVQIVNKTVFSLFKLFNDGSQNNCLNVCPYFVGNKRRLSDSVNFADLQSGDRGRRFVAFAQ
jgi:hypothetical protein